MKLNEIATPKLSVIEFIKDQSIRRYEINDDGSIDIMTHVALVLEDTNKHNLPVKINRVHGDFYVNGKISNPENLPKWISGHCKMTASGFKTLKPIEYIGETLELTNCSNFESLEDMPEVEKSVKIEDCNSFNSLKGCQETINGDFAITRCSGLITLEGCPKHVKWNLTLAINENLESSKGLSTMSVDGTVSLMLNPALVKLEEVPKVIDNGDLYFSLKGSPFIKNPLILFKIKGSTKLKVSHNSAWKNGHAAETDKILGILNKHLKTGDMIECQEELIEAGFREYARLK